MAETIRSFHHFEDGMIIETKKYDLTHIPRETMSIEDRILALGLIFRNLTLHSNGEWSIQYRLNGTRHLVSGKTIDSTLSKLEAKL